MILNIKKRSWEVVDFDKNRIIEALKKACIAADHSDISFIEELADYIVEQLELNHSTNIPDVEAVQDLVEKSLMAFWKFEIAKKYILYREIHIKERNQEKEKIIEKLEKNKLSVIKTNWSKEHFDMKKIHKFYNKINKWYEKKCNFKQLEDSLKNSLVDKIKTSDILKLIVKLSIDLISVENISWQFIAGRLFLSNIYKQAFSNRKIEFKNLYSPTSFKSLFDDYIKSWLYYKDFYKYYSEKDILEAWKHLNKDRDFEYNYTTILMFNKRYLLNPNKIIKELPQEMYMSVALFLAIPEKKEDRMKVAMKIYEYTSSQKISLATPTLLNARTNFNQLSSCFKLNLDDDLRAIYHGIENMSQISKFGWWIGVYLWNIRSKGSSIRWVKGSSWWVIPWIKVMNDTALAVNQLWARAWAISVTLDVWHKDIYNFLDLQTETWEIRSKAFDVFPSISVPDIFMKRVESGQSWTLFDPLEVNKATWKNLQDFYWEEFEKFYLSLEKNKKLELSESVDAKQLFKTFLKVTVETGMPYVFFRDTINKANPNKHEWLVYSTQLCTEICQNTSPSKFIEEKDENWVISIKYKAWDTVVCNLASINVAKVHKKKDIKDVIPIATRILDNVINLNFYPIKESEITAKKYRSIWLGFLWLAEYLACNWYKYDDKKARDHADELFELYALETLKSSNQLSKQRWSYELFKGSDWHKWILFWRNEKWYEKNAKYKSEWKQLIKDIKKDGIRFWYHLAPAPNTSTASVVGTTASLLPIYKKYFVETNSIAPSVMVAPNLSSKNFWLYKEYVNMDMNDVIDMISIIYKWVDQSISFEWLIDPSKVSPFQLYSYYIKAWKQGIKTVYYVRSMSWEIKEDCISCSG